MPVLHTKALWYNTQLNKAQPLIKVSCVNVGGNHSIELQHPEAM